LRAIPIARALKLINFSENLLFSLSFVYYRVVAHSCFALGLRISGDFAGLAANQKTVGKSQSYKAARTAVGR
jgi:hypothetical protein